MYRCTNIFNQKIYKLKAFMYHYSTTINVVLWDKMAEELEEEIDKNHFEEPLILIISSGKIGIWKGKPL